MFLRVLITTSKVLFIGDQILSAFSTHAWILRNALSKHAYRSMNAALFKNANASVLCICPFLASFMF